MCCFGSIIYFLYSNTSQDFSRMNRTKFSVLISLYYNENPEFLRKSLDSIFQQTLLPDEVVLVEDGPLTSALYEVVDEFADNHAEIKRVVLKENRGLGQALNEGLKHCSYDLVARMDTDDICMPHRFAKQVDFMEKHTEFDVVGAWIDEFQNDVSNVISTRKLPEYPDEIYQFGKKRNPMNHPVVMFRKQTVESAGGYQPFHLFEDYFLWVRMMLNGNRMYNIPESLLLFRSSPDMYLRRGGMKYAQVEIKFQWQLYRLGYIGLFRMLSNIGIRITVRVIPNKCREWIYKNLLRR